jgi:hypothetical protein
LPRTWAGSDLYGAVRDARSAAWFEAVTVGPDESLAEALKAAAFGTSTVDEALERFALDGTIPWLVVEAGLDPAELRALSEAHARVAGEPRAVVVEHSGEIADTSRLTAPTLRVHYLYGVVAALDTHVELSQVAPKLSPSRRAEIVELAGYDLDLATQLAAAEQAGHDRYVALCRARARQLALNGRRPSLPDSGHISVREPRALEPLWQLGAVDLFDGAPLLHPGLASEEEIDRRLWRGQIRELLPFLDEMRLALIEATQRRGLFVQPGRGDTVELVDLLRALQRRTPNDELTRAARELTQARNDLAHLRLVDEQRRVRLREAIRRARLASATVL